MKKSILFLALLFGVGNITVMAQTEKVKTEVNDEKTKTKPKTTISDKAHNVIHPKHKRSHGWKHKHKHPGGVKTKSTTKTEEPIKKEE